MLLQTNHAATDTAPPQKQTTLFEGASSVPDSTGFGNHVSLRSVVVMGSSLVEITLFERGRDRIASAHAAAEAARFQQSLNLHKGCM